MKITDLLGLLGGLSLFLYGIRFMGEGLELLAGSRLKSILEKVTRNRFFAMLVGMSLTAIIQSSNALTAMTVSFVNLGLLDFSRAIGVIMGSNIGTTITGQLIALNITQIAPIFAFVGVVLFLFIKKSKVHYSGQILAGLGILFMGMSLMSSSMAPLKNVVWFQNVMVGFSNPLIGVLVGTVFTLLIQSSSASVGVLQALASQNLISLSSGIYIICGQNIGCTIAAIMAAIGGNKNAKRTALVHLLFNITGTIMFIVAARLTPVVAIIESLTPTNAVAQIANAHTLFNISTTLVLLPLATQLGKITTLLIPGEDEKTGPRLMHIAENRSSANFGVATIAIDQIDAEVERMFLLAKENLVAAFDAFFDTHSGDIENIYANEETIDFLNKEITRVLIEINAMELTAKQARRMAAMYHVISDIERVGDHAENIADYVKLCREKGKAFSETATKELEELTRKVYAILDDAFDFLKNPVAGRLDEIDDEEESIDDLVEDMQRGHIKRLEKGKCETDMGMIFVEILTDLERIADHALNIAQAAEKAK